MANVSPVRLAYLATDRGRTAWEATGSWTHDGRRLVPAPWS
ncbi:hypothetical protein [Hamadaea tsunoensis]|nr:hypothetical protein [Hamadaea tsunoensis]